MIFHSFVYWKWINNVSSVKSREKISPVSDLRPAELIKGPFRDFADIFEERIYAEIVGANLGEFMTWARNR